MSHPNTLTVVADTGEVATPVTNPLDLPAEVFSAGLERRKSNRAELMNWVRQSLVEGVDYGRIHVVGKNKCNKGKYCTNENHFSKPSLFKPGAEKICGMLGVTSSFPSLSDYEQSALNGVVLQQIIIRCELSDVAGHVVADGIGARAIKQDYGDINKALKMAEKSAHIDATLRMAGLSEVFTQDLEDINVTHTQSTGAAAADSNSVDSHQYNSAPQNQAPDQIFEAVITSKQHKMLEALISELSLDRERVKSWLKRATARSSSGPIEHFPDLPQSLFEPLLDKLDQWSETQQQSQQE